jgi:hypothetical protein
MRKFLFPVLIVTMSGSQAFATSPAPLEPGKPAGVHKAQFEDNGTVMIAIAGAALVGIGIALATAGDDAAGPTATNATTGTTSTSP